MLTWYQSYPRVGSTHGMGWVGLGRVEIFSFLVGWVGSWVKKTFPKIIKLVTAEVIPDNLIMINTDK